MDFQGPRKDPTKDPSKIRIIFNVFDIANQLLTRHSPFASLCQIDEWMVKRSPFSIFSAQKILMYHGISTYTKMRDLILPH